MRIFKSRLKKLEAKLQPPRLQLRQLEYPADATGSPQGDFWAALVDGPSLIDRNALQREIGPLAAMLAPRVVLYPSFGSESDWETAAARQQAELKAVARSRTNEPATEAPDIVGTIAEDVPAPKRKGEKGRRFVELADGRTFDTETRQYVDEDGKPTAKAGGLSVEWKQ